MLKKRDPQIVKGSVSPQPLPESNLYMGHKTSPNHSVQGGASFKRRKFGGGGCGCGSNPKQTGRQFNK